MGNIGSEFAAEDVSLLKKKTPFSVQEATYLMNRYAQMDPSKGDDGISEDDCIRMPEFTGCIFAPDIISFYLDKTTKRIHPVQFMKICTILNPKTEASAKKECLFEMFDIDKQKILTHDAIFRIYKLMFSEAVTDDHILALTFSALRHPRLTKDGEVSRQEFMEMIPDYEINERFHVNLIPEDL